MFSVLGLVGADFVLICADQSVSRSIVVYQDTEDKLLRVDDNKLIGASGPAADRSHFLEYIEKNVALYALRAGHRLSTHATAAFTRNELAEAIRKGPYQVNCLIGGIDGQRQQPLQQRSPTSHIADRARAADICCSGSVPALYWLDYLGSLHRVQSGAHGYGSYFALSLFDRFYHSSCSLDEGLQVMARVVQELRLRFLLKVGNIKCKAVTREGVRELQLPAL